MILGIKKIRLKQQGQLLGYSVLLAHFFIALGRDDAFWGLFWQSTYYQDLFFVSIIVFMVSLLVSFIWMKLDLRYSWQERFKKRLILQITAGILLPAFLSLFLVFCYMVLILKQDIFQTSYFYYELPVSLVIILMLNLIFGLQYLTQTRIVHTPPLPSIPSAPVVVQSGISTILLEPENIFFVEKEGPVCFVYTGNQIKYIFPHSLDRLSQQLQQTFFFRTNRQTVTHRNNCLSFETERSGKLILSLRYPTSKKITISQKKAREFKFWLKGNL